MEPRLSSVTLATRDLAGQVAFYERLGLTAGVHVPGEVAFFALNGVILGLWTGLAGSTEGVQLAHNVGSPAEVDAFLEAAVAAGASLDTPGHAQDWGGYSGIFRDPEGHQWEVAHNPGWPIDSEGNTTLTPPPGSPG